MKIKEAREKSTSKSRKRREKKQTIVLTAPEKSI